MIRLFYLPRSKFYEASGTWVGTLYTVGTHQRMDWGKVGIAIEAGHTVEIRPANHMELLWAYEELERVREAQKELFG